MVTQYLSTYAILPGGPPKIQGDWNHVLVVPCFDESADFLHRLAATQQPTSLLVVAVINRPEGSNSACNDSIRQYLASLQTQSLPTGHQLHQLGETLAVLSIDLEVLEGPTAPAQGVGRARRVGCDTFAVFLLDGVPR